MKAANLSSSKRLQRVATLLSDGNEHATLDIMSGANVCAGSAIVSELRQNGHQIGCERRGDLWFYRMAPIMQN